MLKKRLIYYFVLVLIPIVVVINYQFNPNILHSKLVEILLLCATILISVLSLIFCIQKKTFWYRFLLVSNIVFCVVITVWNLFSKYDMLHVFSSISSFKEFILSTKEKGMIIYVLVQFIQVLSVPIPSMIITLTGVAIYGPLLGSVLCTTGVLLGSYCSFMIGKVFGFKLVAWMAGKENAVKYADIINQRGKFFLIIAFLLPLFPDDILCLIAGITTMKFKHFFWITLITRPIGVICMSYFGGGYIIPFTGWGLFVWPFILIFAVAAVYASTKYQPQIEKWILNKISIFTTRKKKNS